MFEKCLRLPSWLSQELGGMDEEEEADDQNRHGISIKKEKMQSETKGTVLNLLSEDLTNIMMFFWMGHYVWAIPLKVGSLVKNLHKYCRPMESLENNRKSNGTSGRLWYVD